MTEPAVTEPAVMELVAGAVAHGGHCVARVDGRVVFVRHALPGERVRARITGAGPRGRYLFADAVEIVEAAPGRRQPPCPVAGPGGCGGCDWQHADPVTQRELKGRVLTEQLRRLGGVEVPVEVAAVAGDDDGLGWRTRVRYAVAPDGRLGFRRHRSHEVQPVPRCVIAAPDVQAACDPGGDWRPAREVSVVAHDDGVLVRPEPATENGGTVVRTAAGRRWEVPADGFWQVHPGAADALVAAVRVGLAGTDALWDLYAGVGLFAGALAQGRSDVHAVESSSAAAACARRNLGEFSGVRVHRAEVGRWLRSSRASPNRVEAIVLDPPRRGAGREIIDLVSASSAARVAHVACDPAALGRDVGLYLARGWRLDQVTGLDLFPNTYHVEAVAILAR